ncbi:MAG: hypothetical protein IPK50_06350 [Fibrobacterota bacterium]|nr:MAG: hypothetical protein IPK50_06350 [Fibrobacterota bacterium]
MIEGAENIRDIFAIFHDGEIYKAELNKNTLTLFVWIRYLTQRINANFTYFIVDIYNITDVKFSTWESIPQTLSKIDEIFAWILDILQSRASESIIQVECNQTSPECHYCGGELSFCSDHCEVSDESGKKYSIDELEAICNEYWDEFANRNASKTNNS